MRVQIAGQGLGIESRAGLVVGELLENLLGLGRLIQYSSLQIAGEEIDRPLQRTPPRAAAPAGHVPGSMSASSFSPRCSRRASSRLMAKAPMQHWAQPGRQAMCSPPRSFALCKPVVQDMQQLTVATAKLRLSQLHGPRGL